MLDINKFFNVLLFGRNSTQSGSEKNLERRFDYRQPDTRISKTK